MYDIHCHLLPGVDDGPSSLEEALAMAALAKSQGTRLVVWTPHAAQVQALGGKEVVAQRLGAFLRELRCRENDLEIVLGAEYFLEPQLLEMAGKEGIIGLNGSRYVLVEIDFLQYPLYTEDLVFQLQVGGFVPVLAHPERQATIQDHPELLARLVDRGVVSQITGGSLSGGFGREAQKSAEELLRRNLVHVVASDGHAASGPRQPVLAPALQVLERLVGEGAAATLVTGNPSAIVSNGGVALPDMKVPRRRLPWIGRS